MRVAVAGAGLSGICAAASILKHTRRSGKEVLVGLIEDHPQAYEELSGEACSEPTLRTLNDLGFAPRNSWIRRRYSKIRVSFPEGSVTPPYLEAKVDGYILDKTEVTRDCIEHLASQDALSLLTSCTVRNVARHDGSFKLKISGPAGNQFPAFDAVVGATGYNASLSRMKEVKGEAYLPRDVLLASLDFGLQANVKGDFAEVFNDGRIDITFVAGRPSAEYFYVFPFSEEQGYVGYLSNYENRKTCKDQLLKSLKKYRLRVVENIEHKLRGKFIPAAGSMSKPYAQGFLAVGDEAGQVEPIFRGGIRLGCEAGKIAGHTVSRALEDGDLSRDSLSRYDDELKKIPAIDYIDELVDVKNSIMPKICSYQPVRNDELPRVLRAFSIIENSGW